MSFALQLLCLTALSVAAITWPATSLAQTSADQSLSERAGDIGFEALNRVAQANGDWRFIVPIVERETDPFRRLTLYPTVVDYEGAPNGLPIRAIVVTLPSGQRAIQVDGGPELGALTKITLSLSWFRGFARQTFNLTPRAAATTAVERAPAEPNATPSIPAVPATPGSAPPPPVIEPATEQAARAEQASKAEQPAQAAQPVRPARRAAAPAGDRVRLSGRSTQSDQSRATERNVAGQMALREAQSRIRDLESQVSKLNELIRLKEQLIAQRRDELRVLQQGSTVSGAAAVAAAGPAAAAAASAATPTPPAQPAEPPQKLVPVTAPVAAASTEEPEWLGMPRSGWLLIAGLILGVLALWAFALWARRRARLKSARSRTNRKRGAFEDYA